jgi:DNA-binding NtrC family response regulator
MHYMDKKTKILVVDDQREICEVIRLVLKDKYSIVTAGGAEEALRYLAANPVRLVLLDNKMSKVDGITVLERIKEEHPETEVIIVTAYATIEIIRRAIKLGAYGFLMKPFDVDILINTVEAALKGSEE